MSDTIRIYELDMSALNALGIFESDVLHALSEQERRTPFKTMHERMVAIQGNVRRSDRTFLDALLAMCLAANCFDDCTIALGMIPCYAPIPIVQGSQEYADKLDRIRIEARRIAYRFAENIEQIAWVQNHAGNDDWLRQSCQIELDAQAGKSVMCADTFEAARAVFKNTPSGMGLVRNKALRKALSHAKKDNELFWIRSMAQALGFKETEYDAIRMLATLHGLQKTTKYGLTPEEVAQRDAVNVLTCGNCAKEVKVQLYKQRRDPCLFSFPIVKFFCGDCDHLTVLNRDLTVDHVEHVPPSEWEEF